MSLVTIITPTTGKASLSSLIESVDQQTVTNSTFHVLLWDDKRDSDVDPQSFNSANRFSIVCPSGTGKNGDAPGSQLRAIGLMAAKTPWVTFADDDVRWEPNHLQLLNLPNCKRNWITTLRNIWNPVTGLHLGVDRFESVGDDPGRRVPYEMCDGNTMTFSRQLGSAAAYLYRETTDYNDDRLMYQFLKANAGPRAQTNVATINQICPVRLIDFFRDNCSPK